MDPSSLGPVASAARVAATVFRSAGDMGTSSPQSSCRSQKLVKNCSNFLLVKQTSQTNRPQLFVAARNRNAAKTNISVSVSVSRLSSLLSPVSRLPWLPACQPASQLPRQDTFRSLSRLLALKSRRCQYFVNLRRPQGIRGRRASCDIFFFMVSTRFGPVLFVFGQICI